MVENRPWLTVMSHAVLIAGILVISFPLYVTFVASTHTLDDILKVPMPLLPGDQLWENYRQVLTAGTSKDVTAPVGRMMFNSLVMAVAIAVGKIAISLIASFAIVYFRFPLRNFFFWMIFVTLMLPVEVRILRAVGSPDADRGRADGGAVPLRRAQGAVLMVAHRG